MIFPQNVEITEVGPRDGIQNVHDLVSFDGKVAIIRKMAEAGFKQIEAVSFVSPKAIPQMADAKEVFMAVKDDLRKHGVRSVALVPNARGVETAVECGVDEVTYVISVSEQHNMANVRRTPAESMEQFRQLIEQYKDQIDFRLGLVTALGSPFAGEEIRTETVVDMARFGLESQLDPELLRPKMFFINLLLIVVVVATLVVMPDVPPHIVFMVAFAVALLINYPNSKDQIKVFKLHAGEAWFVASIIFAAGFFSGVMSGAELPTHMAELLMSIIPESFLKHVHVVFALFEPIMDPIGMGSDVQAYGIWPVLANILAPLDPARVGAFMVMPFTISNYIAPTTGATYLAIGLAGVEIGDHMKFCFKYFWAIGVIMVLVALVLGVVPL